jgi:hypothetical protein
MIEYKPSDAAKAAALMHHTFGIEDYAQALEVYNTLANNSELTMEEYLADLGAGRWGELDNLTEYEWWENVESLALSIEAARMWEQARGETK